MKGKTLYKALYRENYPMPDKIDNYWKAAAAAAVDRDLDALRRAFFALRHHLVVKKRAEASDDIEFEPTGDDDSGML